MNHIIEVSNLSKAYKIGEFSGNSLQLDLKRKLNSFFNSNKSKKSILTNDFIKNQKDENLVWSLNDVSFNIEKGDTIGIVGRNGAGKSTLLKILSRITSPTCGEIRMKGKVSSLLEVGTGFHPDLSGRDNIFLNGTILGMRRHEISRKFDEIVDFSGVAKFIDTPVKRYSSGMYVRLAFAVAAYLESDILIVDEVLAVGDAEFQKKCIGKMSSVSKNEGKTILFVSHNLQAVRQLCKSAIMLENGSLITLGSVGPVLKRYMNISEEKSFCSSFQNENVGNLAFALKKISILDSELEIAKVYEISKKYFVELEYIVKKPAIIKLSLIILANDGNELFASLNNHEPNYYGNVQEVGEYKSLIEIPENIFNNGTFTLNISSFMDYEENFNLENLLVFEAVDDGVLKKDFFAGFGGYIRPKLNWFTFKV
jgi:lipopolysaccharide transport system ATP-binding protein